MSQFINVTVVTYTSYKVGYLLTIEIAPQQFQGSRTSGIHFSWSCLSMIDGIHASVFKQVKGCYHIHVSWSWCRTNSLRVLYMIGDTRIYRVKYYITILIADLQVLSTYN